MPGANKSQTLWWILVECKFDNDLELLTAGLSTRVRFVPGKERCAGLIISPVRHIHAPSRGLKKQSTCPAARATQWKTNTEKMDSSTACWHLYQQNSIISWKCPCRGETICPGSVSSIRVFTADHQSSSRLLLVCTVTVCRKNCIDSNLLVLWPCAAALKVKVWWCSIFWLLSKSQEKTKITMNWWSYKQIYVYPMPFITYVILYPVEFHFCP